MKTVNIKHTDIQITPVNLGGNVFGWTLNEAESFKILDKFVDLGGNFIDTANTYSWWINQTGGQSEEIIGKWLKERNLRSKMILATKVGSQNALHPINISRQHILQEIDASLQRLQTDYIDIYYTHFDDETTPIEETLNTYAELIRAGKIRYIAASNISVERLTESLEFSIQNNLPHYIALQPHYNLIERQLFETNYRPIVEQYQMNVFPYYALASGFLTGKYRERTDFERTVRGAGLKHYFNDRGINILEALKTVATQHSVQSSSVALAWLTAQPTITAPIVSATKEQHLQEIFDSLNLQLTESELNFLSQSSN